MIAFVLVGFIYLLLQRLVQVVISIPFEALVMCLSQWGSFRKSLFISGVMNFISFFIYLFWLFLAFIFQRVPPFDLIASIQGDTVLIFRVISFWVISVFVDTIFLFLMSGNLNVETSKILKRVLFLLCVSLLMNTLSILLIYVVPYIRQLAM